MRKFWIATLAAAVLASSPSQAINTRKVWDGSTAITSFGCWTHNTSNYGQVITVPKKRHTLGNFSFFVSGPNVGGQMTVRAEVYAWDALHLMPTGTALWESDPRTIAYKDANYHRATFSPNVSVTHGAQYILFLTTDKDPDSCVNYYLYWAGVPVGTYGGGHFYYLNNTGGDPSAWTTATWSSYIYDAAFTAKLPDGP
ncbi:MAG TPA: hypothetical protein VMF58_15830 [Rhizomicrobium sp.]|nr:hypothetical protein [Rhizomicrobium sp.]